MNSSPPRLPRLGGHKSSPPHRPAPAATAPSGPTAHGPSARIEPARASNSPERPYIDVGYDDDDGVPLAQQQVHLLASLRGTTPSTPQQQAPSPPRPGRASASPSLSSSSTPASQSWKDVVRTEVLLGPRLASANSTATAPAAARGESGSGSSSESRDVNLAHGAGDGSLLAMPAVLPSSPAYPSVSSPAVAVPVMSIPESPASVASSLATDTPRSILRRPGRDRGATTASRSGRRRISFVDLSPLRDESSRGSSKSPDDRQRHRDVLTGDDDDSDDDDYDFAEPLLRYGGTPPPQTSHSAHAPLRTELAEEEPVRPLRAASGTPPSPHTPDLHRTAAAAAAATRATGERSPDVPSSRHLKRRSPSSSPERPVSAGRSPTRSPPRDTAEAPPRRLGTATLSAAAVSAPPPPEEENDVLTLDIASPLRPQGGPRRPQQQHHHYHHEEPRRRHSTSSSSSATPSSPAHRSPVLEGRGAAQERTSPRRSGSSGRDEDVLTQPHNQSHRPSVAAAAPPAAVETARGGSGGRRPPTRQRWPSDAYVEEPPTEVSATQRGGRRGSGHRESLDPEDDMGSSVDSRSSGSSYVSDDGPSFHYEPPVKATTAAPSQPERASSARRTPSPAASSPSRSPPRDERARQSTRSPSESVPRSPSRDRLPERRRSSRSVSEGRSSSVASASRGPSSDSRRSSRSTSSRERPIPSTPNSLTERLDSGRRHRHSPSREELPTSSSSLRYSTLLPTPVNDSHATKRGGEVQPAAQSREGSGSGSRGRSPSTITNHSSGRSFSEEAGLPTAAPAAVAAAAQPEKEKEASTHRRSVERAQETHEEHRHRHRHRHAVEPTSLVHSPHRSSVHSSTHSTPKKKSALPAPAPPSQREAATRKTKKVEPQVYVDPLLRERQHLHERTRQQSPTHSSQHSPPTNNTAAAAERPHVRASVSHSRHSTRRVSQGGAGSSSSGGATHEPVSLRDIMAQHDSPATQQQRRSSSVHTDSARSRHRTHHSKKETEGKAVARPILHEKSSSSSRALVRGAERASQRAIEETASEASRLSSGGVAAEDLLSDASTPTSRNSSRSPPATPSSSSAAVATTPGGHKVFRKKLVVVVRRRKSGAAPSADDPVTQMSMLPYKEGSPAVQRAEAHQAALQRQRDASENGGGGVGSGRHGARKSSRSSSVIGAVSAPTTTGVAPLERLIDHVQPGRVASVTSRRSSRTTHIREDRVGEEDEDGDAEEARRAFRRALSVASSRSASRRSSVAPSARSRRSHTGSVPSVPLLHAEVPTPTQTQHSSSGRRSKEELHNPSISRPGQQPSVAKARRSRSSSVASASAVAPVAAVADGRRKRSIDADGAASTATATSRKDEATMTPSRHRHRHVSSSRRSSHHSRVKAPQSQLAIANALNTADSHTDTSSAVNHQRQQQQHQQRMTAAQTAQTARTAVPDASYRPAQNDDFYFGGGGLEKEVAELKERTAPRIGITSVAMPLLPRLTLAADEGLNGGAGPRSNADAQGVAAWTDSDDDDVTATGGRIAAAPRSGSRRQRLLLQQASATQTDRVGPGVLRLSDDTGMPLAAATPIVRPSIAAETRSSAAPPVEAVELLDAPLAAVAATAAARANTVPGVGGSNGIEHAAASSPENDDDNVEAPASFVKRTTAEVAGASSRRASTAAAVAQRTGMQQPVLTAHAPPQQTIVAGTQQLAAFPQPAPFYAGSYPLHNGGPPAIVPAASAPPTVASASGVPLFVPSLTVDNVSHLTQEWQSTLRERAGKVRQNAMEQFLIASAEAGAASTLHTGYAQAAPQPPLSVPFNTTPRLLGAMPFEGYGDYAVSGGAAGAPAAWNATRWPAQQQPGLPSNEFYGGQPQLAHQQQQFYSPAAAAAVPQGKAVATPPRVLPPSFWEMEREVRQEDARVAAEAMQQPRRTSVSTPAVPRKALVPAKAVKGKKDDAVAPPASTEKATKDRLSLLPSPTADDFDLVEGSEVGNVDEEDYEVENNSIQTVSDVQPLSPRRLRATRSLTPPTAAALASEQSSPRHSRQRRSSSSPRKSDATPAAAHPRERASHRNSAAAAAAIATASKGRRTSLAPAHAGFAVVEPTPAVLTAKSKTLATEKHAKISRHASLPSKKDQLQHRQISAPPPAARDRPKSATKRSSRKHKEENEEAREKHRKDERRHKDKAKRRSASSTSSSSSSSITAASPSQASFFCAPNGFDFSPSGLAGLNGDGESSDVDSDLATSMEFQLSRLLLQRERRVSDALKSLEQQQHERDAAKQAAARREREKKEGHGRRTREREHSRRSTSKERRARDRHARKSKGDKQEEKEKDVAAQKKKTREERHRTPSAEKKQKKLTKEERHKEKHDRHHRSKSKPAPLPLPPPPPPPLQDPYTDWAETPRARSRADFGAAESRYTSPSYESLGASRYEGTAASPYSYRDYPPRSWSRAAAREAREEASRSSSARPYFRSRSDGLDNHHTSDIGDTYASRYGASPYNNYRRDRASGGEAETGEGLSASRYARLRPYTPLSSSRYGETPRRTSVDDGASGGDVPRAHGRAATRPSTHWTDYVRSAGRMSPREDATASASTHYTSYGQRRQSSNGGGSLGGASAADRYARRPSPFTSTTPPPPSYTSRAADYDDIDDIPRRSYFNSDEAAPAKAAPSSLPTSYTARRDDRDRPYEKGERRSSYAAPSYSRPRTATSAKAKKDDDILVSTPSQDGDGDRADSHNYWDDRESRPTQPRRGAPPPPPPSLPRDSLNGSTRTPSLSDQAARPVGLFPTTSALPIIKEHVVVDAQAAHDFADGVRGIVSALQQHVERV